MVLKTNICDLFGHHLPQCRGVYLPCSLQVYPPSNYHDLFTKMVSSGILRDLLKDDQVWNRHKYKRGHSTNFHCYK
jgi:hypothetical protein